MAHHGSPDGAGYPGGPAQPAQLGVAEPSPGYQQSAAPAYAPDQGYGAPAPDQAYGAPAPDQGYGAGAPTGYVPPQQSAFYAPTQPTGYVAPAPGYGAPTPGYGDRPMSAPPLVGTPMSAPPLMGVPMSAPPMSAPPASGGPGYATGAFGVQPVPGQPGYGQTGYQPAIDPMTGMPIQGAVAPRKRGVAVPLLAGFLALAVLAAGVLAGLYINQSNKLTKSDKVVAQQKQAIADRDDELKKTKADLQDKSDALATAQQDLRGTQADNTETKHEKDIIAKCLSMIDDALTATSNSAFNTKWKALQDPCKAADAVLGL